MNLLSKPLKLRLLNWIGLKHSDTVDYLEYKAYLKKGLSHKDACKKITDRRAKV